MIFDSDLYTAIESLLAHVTKYGHRIPQRFIEGYRAAPIHGVADDGAYDRRTYNPRCPIMRDSCSSAVPSAASNKTDVGQNESIPISRSMLSSSALRRTESKCALSILPSRRASLKWTTLTSR